MWLISCVMRRKSLLSWMVVSIMQRKKLFMMSSVRSGCSVKVILCKDFGTMKYYSSWRGWQGLFWVFVWKGAPPSFPSPGLVGGKERMGGCLLNHITTGIIHEK